jgi:O-antigen/teichoic acid export membrane protein
MGATLMNPSRQRVARSLAWSGLESVGLSGLSFVSLVVFSRFLSPTEFGVASMALAVIQILAIPVEIGFHDALVQKQDATDRHFDSAFCAATALGLALCGLCWLAAPLFARYVGSAQAGEVLQWMSLSLPASGIGCAVIARQRRELQFRNLAVRSLAGRLTAAVAGIAAAVAGAGVWSLVLQQVLMVALSTATLWWLSPQRPALRFHGREFMELTRFGIKSVSSLLLVFSIQRVFMLIVGNRFGAEAAGYLNLAFRAVDMLRDLISSAVSQLALPFFARYQADRPALYGHYMRAVEMTCTAMFPVFATIAVATPEIVDVVFGAKWRPAIPYIVLMSVLTFQFFPRMFSSPLMTSLGRPAFPIPSQILQLSIIVVGMLTIGQQSLAWAAAVWGLRLVVTTPFDMVRFARHTGMSAAQQLAGVPLAAALAFAAAGLALLVSHTMPAGEPALLRLLAVLLTSLLAYLALTLLFNRRVLGQMLLLGKALRAR